jgi:putative ABC transport system substrate-binding protein
MRSSLVRAALALLAIASVLVLAPAPRAAGPRVAVIKSSGAGPFAQATDALLETLRASRLKPEVSTFDLESEPAKASAALLEVRRQEPALIVAVGSLAVGSVLKEPWRIPVLFSMVLYPAQSGFTARSGQAVGGVSLDIPLDVQFETLRRLLPRGQHIGVLYHPAETGEIIAAARPIAPQHGFTLDARRVDDPADAIRVLDELLEHVDAVWTVADSHVFTPQTTSPLILAALRRRVPLFGISPAQVRMGALATLACDYRDVGQQTAEVALRVLQGEANGALPVVSPRKIDLVLNLRTADHIGLTIAPELERKAAEVIR